jgi:hypothetical protein
MARHHLFKAQTYRDHAKARFGVQLPLFEEDDGEMGYALAAECLRVAPRLIGLLALHVPASVRRHLIPPPPYLSFSLTESML